MIATTAMDGEADRIAAGHGRDQTAERRVKRPLVFADDLASSSAVISALLRIVADVAPSHQILFSDDNQVATHNIRLGPNDDVDGLFDDGRPQRIVCRA